MDEKLYWVITWEEKGQWDRQCMFLWATAEEADRYIKEVRPEAENIIKLVGLTEEEYRELKGEN